MAYEYTVFHTTEAGSPRVYFAEFLRHGYVFEPLNWDGAIFSNIYDTTEEAEEAAKAWAFAEEAEANYYENF